MRTHKPHRWQTLLAITVASAFVTEAYAQTTTTNGKSLALRDSGNISGNNWVLSGNGYAGTYVHLDAPGAVTFTARASATGTARMDLVIDDALAPFDVSGASADYTYTLNLPAGTHFIRTEQVNNADNSHPLTLNSLTVSGATVLNQTDATNANKNALDAADTYIANYRKGNAAVTLKDPNGVVIPAGTAVHVSLRKNDFNFGTAIGSEQFLTNNPSVGSTQYKFQQALNANFNTVVPENVGKWDADEAVRDVQTMGAVDMILNYAQAHGMNARMHNLIWGAQQPSWVLNGDGTSGLLNKAMAGDAVAKAALRAEISERIQYYIADRSAKFSEIDILNEAVHQSQYLQVFGAAGIADIYNEAAAAAAPGTKLFTNEYSVLEDSSDTYSNWYRQHVEQIRAAGGDLNAIGVQYYTNASLGTGNSQHNPSRIFGTLQNLSITGLPIELTEFGIKGGGTPEVNAQILNEAMRLVYGNANADGFMMWGFWAGSVWDQAAAGVLYDSNWNITSTGLAWQALMAQWDTDLQLAVGPNGQLNFNGFYGDYDVTINGQTYALNFDKGTNQYFLTVIPEPTCLLLPAGAVLLLRRRR